MYNRVDVLECKKNREVNDQEGYVWLKSNYGNMAYVAMFREKCGKVRNFKLVQCV